MATVVPYLPGGTAITPDEMNDLFRSFDSRLDTLLGGRSFLIAFRNVGSQSAPNGETNYTSTPHEVLGKCFFFLDGAVHYSRFAPGFRAKTVTVTDPTTGGSVSAQGGYSHDETIFDGLTIAPVSYDYDNHVVTIQDIPAASYPAWLSKIPSVSIFEHSLRAFTVELQGPEDAEAHQYYLKEQSCPIPTKRYERALAEIIIEGPHQVLVSGTLDKFKCYRFHNLQPQQCQVALGSISLTLQPFECQTWRDSGNGFQRSQFRYFCEFQDRDPRDFWFHPRLPDGSQYYRVATSVGGMQGNNVCNPTVLYDFIRRLTDTRHYAFFEKDTSAHVCDIFNLVPELREKFGKRGAVDTTLRNEWLLGDCLHHRGTFAIARTTGHPANPVTTFEAAEFPGYQPTDQFIAYMAARGITVTEDSSTGSLKLQNTDATKRVDIIQYGTNFLKSFDSTQRWITQTGRNIDGAGHTIERNVFEVNSTTASSMPYQNPDGTNEVILNSTAGYRIARRALDSTARSATYRDIDGVTKTVTGAPTQRIREVFQTPPALTGIHTVSLSDLLTLRYFGATAADLLEDGHVQFADPQITLTPFGLWLTFEERITADYLHNYTAYTTPNPTWYYNTYLNRLRYDEASDKWILKHCVRFRGHGWGYGEHGRNNAAFYGPVDGRIAVRGYSGDVLGKDGADETVVRQSSRSTIAKLLRRIDVSELGITNAGERFLTTPKPSISPPFIQIDALLEFQADSTWYNTVNGSSTNRLRLIPYSNQSRLRGPTVAMPLSVVHYNAMAMAVNQLTTGRPLDSRAFAFIVGNKILSFDPQASVSIGMTPLPSWDMGGPAPVDAFTRFDNVATAAYWEHLFSSRAVMVRGVSSFPASYQQFKTFRSERRNWKYKTTVDLWNGVHSGFKLVWEAPDAFAPYNWAVFRATLSGTIGDVRFGDPINIGQLGDVLPYVAGPTINLNTTYSAGLRWVSIGDVRTWFDSIGIPFNYAEAFIPLKIVECEAPARLRLNEDYSHVSHSLEGEVYAESSFRQGTPGAPGPSHLARINQIVSEMNAATARVQEWEQAFTPFNMKFARFALVKSEDSSDAEWKTATPDNEPRLIWNFRNRTEGTSNRTRFYTHIRFNTAGFGVSGGGGNVVNASATILSLQNQTPWYPSDAFFQNPVGVGEGSGPGSSVSNRTSLRGGEYRHDKREGPRAVIELDTPQDEAEQEKYENLLRQLEAEENWMAVQVNSSAGAKAEVLQVAEPAFAKKFDWWNETSEAYLASLAGTYTAPPRDLAGASHSYQECEEGVTVIEPPEDSAHRVLYDTTRVRITL